MRRLQSIDSTLYIARLLSGGLLLQLIVLGGVSTIAESHTPLIILKHKSLRWSTRLLIRPLRITEPVIETPKLLEVLSAPVVTTGW